MSDLATELELQFRALFEQTPLSPWLREAAAYMLFPGGKRFRPRLALNIASHFGPLIRGWDVALALETLHTFSLIHDDLPCMDDDEERRGQPTLHIAFDEATALLTGDFLLTWSFELLSKAKGFTAEEKVELVQILSEASGGSGMVGGQLLELKASHPDQLPEIYRGKTGRLIEASVHIGRIIAGSKDVEPLDTFGRHLGFSFQLQDDLDDFENDISSGKTTLATHLGKVEATKLLQHHLSLCEPYLTLVPCFNKSV